MTLKFNIFLKSWNGFDLFFKFDTKVYYNLDSKLERPDPIGSEEQLIAYLENLIKSKDKELILIVSKEVELDGSWKK